MLAELATLITNKLVLNVRLLIIFYAIFLSKSYFYLWLSNINTIWQES